MITLTFLVDNISTVVQVYNQIQVQRATAAAGPYATVSGVGPVTLINGQSSYELTDVTGEASSWYISRYYSTSTFNYSSWSEPVLGEPGDIFHNPLYPPEVSYGTSEQLVLGRIRRLIGDPVGLRREYGDDAISSIHADNKTYEISEKGWPVSIFIRNEGYNSSNNPTVNGYKYLRFSDDIADTTWSGCTEYGIDIFWYTFRHSDKEIMNAYDTTPPPPGLTTATATSEAYMLNCSIELLTSELWLDSTEDGASIKDEGSVYNPEIGLTNRRKLLDSLDKKLDDLIKTLILSSVTGILID